MKLLRVFIAIEISPNIRQAIKQQTAHLRNNLNESLVRWVPVNNIHLTLKFLGDVSPIIVDMLSQMLTVEAGQRSRFEMRYGGLGTFPNSRRPRVIWVGVHAPAELEALQHGIEAATTRMGYPTENRFFSPHLTIGRVKQTVGLADAQKIRAALDETKFTSLGTGIVDAIHLFQSNLNPSGSVYTRLFSAPLKKIQSEVTSERN